MECKAGCTVAYMNNATVLESPLIYPGEHRYIILVSVDTYIYVLAFAEVEGDIGNALGSGSCGYAMYGAVGIVI